MAVVPVFRGGGGGGGKKGQFGKGRLEIGSKIFKKEKTCADTGLMKQTMGKINSKEHKQYKSKLRRTIKSYDIHCACRWQECIRIDILIDILIDKLIDIATL